MLLHRRSDTRRVRGPPLRGGGADKYYVTCKDPSDTSSWIQQPFAMDVSNERAIVKAMIDDGRARKNQHVVVKVGPSATIRKEYAVGEAVKGVPGFVRFICAMQCEDDLERYRRNPRAGVCSHAASDPLMNVLVMPYFALGSVRAYAWERHPERLRSCLAQLVLSLFVAFARHGFVHNDIHLDNVLLSETRKAEIEYDLPDGAQVRVPTHGVRIHVMDFGNAFIPVERRQTGALFRDYDRVISDLMFAARLRFDQLPELSAFTRARAWSDPPLSDVGGLLAIIGRIAAVERQPEPTLQYNPDAL